MRILVRCRIDDREGGRSVVYQPRWLRVLQLFAGNPWSAGRCKRAFAPRQEHHRRRGGDAQAIKDKKILPTLMRLFCRKKPVRAVGSRAGVVKSGTNLSRGIRVPDPHVPKLRRRRAVQQRERLAHLVWTKGALKF
jgi:hypothetical protein